MRIAKGPRPWSILIFAAITSSLAVFRLWDSLADLSAATRELGWAFPFIAWSRDHTIVAVSAWFTIDMIPVLLVLIFAARFARIFISVMSLVPLALLLTNLDFASTYPRFLLPSILIAVLPIALAMLLWTSSSSRYFAREEEAHAEIT